MRGWTLGPLGAVILVFLLGGCAYFMIVRGGGDSDEELIRAYYRDQGASDELAAEIEVGECNYTGQDYRSTSVFLCPLTVLGNDVPGACFAIDDEDGKVEAGPRQMASIVGCRPVMVDVSLRP
jgi:hypothetical protein